MARHVKPCQFVKKRFWRPQDALFAMSIRTTIEVTHFGALWHVFVVSEEGTELYKIVQNEFAFVQHCPKLIYICQKFSIYAYIHIYIINSQAVARPVVPEASWAPTA